MIIRCIDFETSGMEPPAQVCEVGLCDIDVATKAIVDRRAWLCSVENMPPEARAIHHISKEECDPFLPFSEASIFETPCVAVVAHNSSFETKFFTPTVPVICTYKAALRVWPDAPSHSNGALRYWLQDQGLTNPDHALTQPPHRAGPDCYVTSHILVALLATGVTGKEMAAWTHEPALLPKCPIGEFRGKPWSEVSSGFLGWMLRQQTMESDLKWNAEREIARRSAA